MADSGIKEHTYFHHCELSRVVSESKLSFLLETWEGRNGPTARRIGWGR